MLKSLVLLLVSVLVIGCSYENVYETMGPDAGQEAETTMRGWSIRKNLVMGTSEPININNKTFLPGHGTGQIGENDAEAGQAAQYTVQIGITQDPSAIATNGPPNVRARVLWNTTGKSIERDVSVGGGTSLTGTAEGVAVVIQDYSGHPVDSSLADYDVTVAIVPGSRASTSVGPSLIPLLTEATYSPSSHTVTPPGSFTLSPDQTVAVEVPANVGVQSVYITPGIYQDGAPSDPVTTLLAVQIDISGVFLKVYPVSMTDGWVPLHPQCAVVTLTNEPNDPVLLTGTLNLVNGNATVDGTGTYFLTQVAIGDKIYDPAHALMYSTVTAIADNTHLTLSAPYGGTTNAAASVLVFTNFYDIQDASLTWGVDG